MPSRIFSLLTVCTIFRPGKRESRACLKAVKCDLHSEKKGNIVPMELGLVNRHRMAAQSKEVDQRLLKGNKETP